MLPHHVLLHLLESKRVHHVSSLLFMKMMMDETLANKDKRQQRLARTRKIVLLLLAIESTRSFRSLLAQEGRHRRRRALNREVLLHPDLSPWMKLYTSGTDGSLITITGFDHSKFEFLLDLFTPFFFAFTPWCSKHGGVDGLQYMRRNMNEKRGKKRMVTAASCLGLTLAWYRFRGAEFVLQGWFGFTGTQTNVWLRFGRRMLLKALKNESSALVEFPTNESIEEWKELINERHDRLQHVYCFADGLKLRFQACSGLSEQGMFYNGWQHGHYITNVFVFGATGRIIHCVINVPGSVHDSTLCHWGGTYTLLQQAYDETGGVCCVDSAFLAGNVDYLIKSSQDLTKARDADHLLQLKQATSLRQAAEWGMRAIQSAFPRMKDAILYEEKGERGVVLKLLPLLYNIRLAKVGLNQILNTYAPHLSKDAGYFIRRRD